MREVILDLPAHPLDLLVDGGRQVGVARGGGALRLLGQDGERRLQAVREILEDSPASDAAIRRGDETLTVTLTPRVLV